MANLLDGRRLLGWLLSAVAVAVLAVGCSYLFIAGHNACTGNCSTNPSGPGGTGGATGGNGAT